MPESLVILGYVFPMYITINVQENNFGSLYMSVKFFEKYFL